MQLHPIQIGDLSLQLPIIQGGMGVGISLSGLAGAVAREGGMGVISAAQPGFDYPGWEAHPLETNLLALKEHIQRAKKQSQGFGGAIGVNIMRACTDYERYVRCAVESGADAIISGAGLPIELPALLKDTDVKFAPIVSSLKAARVLFTKWKRRGDRLCDFLVIEGPKAGGHLGFSEDEALHLSREEFEKEILSILLYVREEGARIGRKIPVFVAGGIFDGADIARILLLGADGVQMATRFVATMECDAPIEYKEAYVRAKKEDVVIVKSPVGMPGRAIRNPFTEERSRNGEKVSRCFHCLSHCQPATTPYCITQALIRAAGKHTEEAFQRAEEGRGKRYLTDDSLLFCGENVWRVEKITTVHAVFEALQTELREVEALERDAS